MPEFIPHEIEVSVPGGGCGDEPDHFVEGDSPVHRQALGSLVHEPVHVLIDQPENDRLVANQRLIVRFGIPYGFLIGPLGSQFMVDLLHVPLLVGTLLDCLDPVIGGAHGQPVTEPDTSVFHR